MTIVVNDPQAAEFGRAVSQFAQDIHIHDQPVDRQAWKRAGALGLTGLEIPAAFGGSAGATYAWNAAAVDALATISHGLSSTFTISFDIATPYLVDLGTPEVHQRWLPLLAQGEAIAALALTEPGAGSDLAALTTRAEPKADHYLITGSKTFITNGSIADVIVVAARTSPQAGARGISLFAVDGNAAGLTRRRITTIGQNDCDTAELFFDQVEVPLSHLLGTLDEGFLHLMDRLPQERITSSIANLAQADVAMNLTLTQVRERQAFGRSLGSLQHNAFRLAELDAQRSAVRAHVDACIERLMNKTMSTADGARAKLLSARLENDILDLGMQLHGGSSFLEGTEINQRWIDGRITRIWAGADEIMLHLIAKDLGL